VEGDGKTSGQRGVRVCSAGGVVVRGEGQHRRVAVMRSAYGDWVLPKGGVEQGESAEQAARREVSEEVGLRELNFLAPLGATEHGFERAGTCYRKHVDWYLFLAPHPCELQASPEEGALEAAWFPKREALRLLAHADQRRIVRRAWDVLRRGCAT